MEYIDIHSHPNFPELQKDLSGVLKRMEESGVGTIAVGVNGKTSAEVVKLAEEHENIWASIGIHPTDLEEEFDENLFEELVKSKKVVAVGECGLDYFRGDEKKEKQKELFKKHIEFALRHDLPLMLHIRPSRNSNDAHRGALEILGEYKKEYGEKLRGNSHFFASGSDIAQMYFDLGFTVSFSGIITYVEDLQKLVRNVPLDKIHIETDSPYAPPEPHRGKTNEPSYVVEVAKKIAEIRDLGADELKAQLLENSQRIFKIRA